MSTALLLLISAFAIVGVFSDTPVHCLYEDYYGEWTYSLGAPGGDNSISCDNFDVVYTRTFYLAYPDVAFDEQGRAGFWTRIYDEGVEIVLDGVKYFAFSYYDQSGFDCTKTLPGWYHDQDGTNWGCFVASRKSSEMATPSPYPVINENREQREAMKNGKPAHFHPILSKETERKRPLSPADLPANFDWRNVDGVNYVSPVRDQGQCGSCYAFGTMAMIEARIRVYSNNTVTPVLSTQNIVSCSEYSQGCDGGFPYLISKYGEDFMFYPEDCFPYTGKDDACTPCSPTPSDIVHASGYHYIGGYYGACSPEEMMMELYVNGPISVSFEVYSDLYSYSGGVYVHNSTITVPKTNPWEITNHVVCIVGWGVDETGMEYWIVKNSWGTGFGVDGYFNIRRNTDECAIESMAVASTPLFQS